MMARTVEIAVNIADIEEVKETFRNVLNALVKAQEEIEVLTQERDNALLRIEELERQNIEDTP